MDRKKFAEQLLVCVGVAWCNGVVFATINCYSCFIKHIQNTFPHADNFTAGGINSMMNGLTFALSPLAGILSDRIGIRTTCCIGSLIAFIGLILSSFAQNIYQLVVTFGVLLGCGFSLTFTPSLVMLAKHFDKRIGLVNGLVTFCGSCLFTVVTPFLLNWILSITTLRMTFRIQSISTIIMFLFSLFTYKLPRNDISKIDKHKQKQKSSTLELNSEKSKSRVLIQRDFYTRDYLLWTLSIGVAHFGFSIIYTFIVPYYLEATTSETGDRMVSVLAFSAAIGRFTIGAVSDLSFVSRVRVQQCCVIIVALIYTSLPHLKSGYVIAPLLSVLGFANGGFVVLLGPVCYDIVGRDKASQALGNALFVCSLFTISGPATGGKIFDVTESLRVPFYSAGVSAFVGALLMTFVAGRTKMSSEKKKVAVSSSSEGEGQVHFWISNLKKNEILQANRPRRVRYIRILTITRHYRISVAMLRKITITQIP
ncbi:monocarboxylate transporter 10-like isoform X2 [Convolutriloba macropyga]|uniref:monocarboxylate transporter 10-like isoform X2 n=1 Tax=Convolutriloba macropyga TaxID=536237 RepID=UPI003F524491